MHLHISPLTFVLIASVGAAAYAQPRIHPIPHALYRSGVLVDIGYDFEGGQPTFDAVSKLVSTKGCVKATASQNSQSLRLMADTINGLPFTPEVWSIHRLRGAGDGAFSTGRISFTLDGITEAIFPALDVNASQAAFFELMMDMSNARFDGFFPVSQEEKIAEKAQKKWLPANFKLELADKPCSRVSKVEALTLKQGVADFDKDGALDWGVTSEIVMYLPVEDSAPYREWYEQVRAGATDTARPLTIVYQDDDGLPLLTLTVDVEITSAYYADILMGTEPTPGREFRVALRAVNNPGVK